MDGRCALVRRICRLHRFPPKLAPGEPPWCKRQSALRAVRIFNSWAWAGEPGKRDGGRSSVAERVGPPSMSMFRVRSAPDLCNASVAKLVDMLSTVGQSRPGLDRCGPHSDTLSHGGVAEGRSTRVAKGVLLGRGVTTSSPSVNIICVDPPHWECFVTEKHTNMDPLYASQSLLTRCSRSARRVSRRTCPKFSAGWVARRNSQLLEDCSLAPWPGRPKDRLSDRLFAHWRVHTTARQTDRPTNPWTWRTSSPCCASAARTSRSP